MNMNECAFLEDVKVGDNFSRVRIEQHHTPFTLYDTVIIVFNKRMFYNEDISVRQVAKEVMKLHYRLLIGLIPLSETTHKLVHNQYLFVPVDKIFGDYNKVVEEYKSFMTPEHLDILNRIEEYSKLYDQKENTSAIEQHTLQLECSGTYKIPDLQRITSAMYGQIENIKDNGYRLPTLKDIEQKKIDNNDKIEDAIYFF